MGFLKLKQAIYFRIALRIASFLIFALLLLDFNTSGIMTIKNATVENSKTQDLHKIWLPINLNTYDNSDNTELYTFSFAFTPGFLDTYRHLILRPGKACIREIRLDSIPDPIPLASINTTDENSPPCSFKEQYLSIPNYFSEDDHRITVVILPKNFKFGFQVEKSPIFNKNQIVFLLGLACYLLCLTFVYTGKDLLRFHCITFFSLTLLGGFEPVSAYYVMLTAVAIFLATSPKQMLSVGEILSRICTFSPVIVVGIFALGMLALCATLSQANFHGLPHLYDSFNHYVQAKIFSEGKLYEKSHALAKFFNTPVIANDGKVYDMHLPGHSLMLSLGYLLGAPWLVNPIMAALTVIAIYLLGQEIGGRSLGYISAALVLISHFIVFMSSEYMSHPTCLFFLTLFMYAYIRQHKTRDIRFAFIAGLSIGFAFITRAQSTIPIGLPFALHALWVICNNPRQTWKCTAYMAAGFGIFLCWILYYNFVLSDTPWRFAKTNPADYITHFFSAHRMANIYNDLYRVLRLSTLLHTFLFGWPYKLSLIFVLLFFIFHIRKPYLNLLTASFLSAFIGLFINPFYDEIFGPRYIYEISTILIVITAACLMELPVLLEKYTSPALATRKVSGGILATAVVYFTLYGIVYHWYNMYWLYKWNGLANANYYHMIVENVKKPALLFTTNYTTIVNSMLPVTDKNPIIVAQDLGAENQKLIDYYPTRNVYYLNEWRLLRAEDLPQKDAIAP